jgi:hypothetical protein
VDLTPPPVVPGGGGVFEEDEDFSTVDLRRKAGADRGHGFEMGVVVDLTPKPRSPLRIILPRRKPRRVLGAVEVGAGAETARIVASAASHDLARFSEDSMVVDLAVEEEDERLVLSLLGIDL